MERIIIKSLTKDYDVYFEKTGDFIGSLSQQVNTCFVIDKNVWNMYRKTFLADVDEGKAIILAVSEDMKNLETVKYIYDKIVNTGLHRDATLVCIGGGILQDITGFVAATMYRGINVVFIPTTLLAQVDACIGGKNGVNFDKYKNLIGTIYPPSHVYILPEFIKTLSDDDYYSGIGEVAKMHLISERDMAQKFQDALPLIKNKDDDILTDLIRASLLIKKSYIEDDEQDFGKRNMLNYGHCFGHAIETVTEFKIPHGQAVVMGMILANKVAVKRGLLSFDNEQYIREQILCPILQVKWPLLDMDEVIKAMSKDKKNVGENLSLIMIDDTFSPFKVTDLTKDEITESLTSVR